MTYPGDTMYKHHYAALGVCNVRCLVHGLPRPDAPQLFEVETRHGQSTIVSTYRYQYPRASSQLHDELSELDLCRYAVGQFLARNENIHVARVEILDTSRGPYPGKLTLVRTVGGRIPILGQTSTRVPIKACHR